MKRLEALAPKSADSYIKADPNIKDAVERNLQLVSDAELDIAMQLYKGMELRLGGDDESVLERVEPKLGKSIVSKLKERRKLRNALIHAYAESAYDKEAFAQAHGRDDIEAFIRKVNELMKASA